MGLPWPLSVYFRSFQTQILQKKTRVNKIRTRIVGMEGEHADQFTTTTAHGSNLTFDAVHSLQHYLMIWP